MTTSDGVADARDRRFDVEDVDEAVVARRLREHRLDRDLDDGRPFEVAFQCRRLGAALDENEGLGGVRRSDRQHLVVAVVGEGEVLGVLNRERLVRRSCGRWLGGGGTYGAGTRRGRKSDAENQGSLEHDRRLLASRCCAWLHRAVSWLPDRRSLPTFQPHIGRGAGAVAFPTAWEFTSRSQLRDSPGFAPVFPLGYGQPRRPFRLATEGCSASSEQRRPVAGDEAFPLADRQSRIDQQAEGSGRASAPAPRRRSAHVRRR